MEALLTSVRRHLQVAVAALLLLGCSTLGAPPPSADHCQELASSDECCADLGCTWIGEQAEILARCVSRAENCRQSLRYRCLEGEICVIRVYAGRDECWQFFYSGAEYGVCEKSCPSDAAQHDSEGDTLCVQKRRSD